MKVLEKTEFQKEHVRLDLRDKKIIKLLSLNARFPLTLIAKHVRLTRDAVKYRIERLEQNEVLTGYLSLVNLKKLGWSSYHVFLELHANPEKEVEWVGFLKKHGNVNAILKYSGKLDYELAIISRDFQEFDKVLQEITQKYPVKDYEILILLETLKSSTFPEKLLDEKVHLIEGKHDGSFARDFSHASIAYEPDKKDLRILRILAEDARIQLVGLAGKIGLSQDAVAYRIKKMIHSRILLEFRPVINFSRLGFYVYTVLLRLENLMDESWEGMKSFIKNHPNILWAVKTIGKWNILFYVITQNEEEFHATMAEFKKRFAAIIKSYEALLASEEYKYTYFPEAVTSSR